MAHPMTHENGLVIPDCQFAIEAAAADFADSSNGKPETRNGKRYFRSRLFRNIKDLPVVLDEAGMSIRGENRRFNHLITAKRHRQDGLFTSIPAVLNRLRRRIFLFAYPGSGLADNFLNLFVRHRGFDCRKKPSVERGSRDIERPPSFSAKQGNIMLTDEIRSEVIGIAASYRVADIRVGLGYTAVALENGRCGLSFTLHEKGKLARFLKNDSYIKSAFASDKMFT
jgi:hypothetical protein